MFKRKSKQENLAWSNAMVSELAIRAISDGVVVCNSAGHILLINPAAINMVGGQLGDALGLEVSSVLILLDVHNRAVSWDFKNIQQPIVRSDLQLKSLSGARLTPVELHIIPAFAASNPDYRIVSSTGGTTADDNFIITWRDISIEQRSEAARIDFISTASHEMRTPVATIDGYLDLALNQKTATIDDRARSFLEKAKDASQHLGELFANLLDVTKIDDQRQELHYEKIDINQFINHIADDARAMAQKKGLSLNLPSNDNKINPIYHIMADKTVLRGILDNLIENAVKYTEKGGISVAVSADDEFVTISVKDTGVGIPAESLPHIFQKFYRVDNRDTRQIGGTGLGLYIVKNSVENMHGKVWAESTIGQGSQFFISLPRVK